MYRLHVILFTGCMFVTFQSANPVGLFDSLGPLMRLVQGVFPGRAKKTLSWAIAKFELYGPFAWGVIASTIYGIECVEVSVYRSSIVLPSFRPGYSGGSLVTWVHQFSPSC